MALPFVSTIRSWLAPATPARASDIEAKLRARLRKAERKLQESYWDLDNYVDPSEYPGGYNDDGGQGWSGIGGNVGTTNGRIGGGDQILLRNPQDLRNLRADARILVETNSYAAGFLSQLVNFIVGDGMEVDFALRGPNPGAVSGGGIVDADGDGVQDVAEPVAKAESIWAEFCEKNDWGCGVEDREVEAVTRGEREAEVFLRFFREEDGIAKVRFTEPEQIEPPPGDPDPLTKEPQYSTIYEWSWGIECDPDDVETRLRYYVRPMNQLGAGGLGKSIDANEFMYFKKGTDRTVKRGISPFAVVAKAFRQAEKINNNMSEVSAIQAAIAYIREHAATTLPGQVSDLLAGSVDYQTTQRSRGNDRVINNEIVQPGTRLDVSAGMKYLTGPTNTGAGGYIQVLQSRLRQICARFGMPEFFTGDSSNANYASTLVSGGPFERAVTRAQKQYAGFVGAVARKVLEMAAEAGRLTEEELASIKVMVTPDPASIANKLEEAQIRQIEIADKVLSVQTAQQETGRDTKQEAANIKAWQQQFPDAGSAGLGADFGGLFGADQPPGKSDAVNPAKTESVVKEIGPPPFEGAVFDKGKHRWVKPGEVTPAGEGDGKSWFRHNGEWKRYTPEEAQEATSQAIKTGRGSIRAAKPGETVIDPAKVTVEGEDDPKSPVNNPVFVEPFYTNADGDKLGSAVIEGKYEIDGKTFPVYQFESEDGKRGDWRFDIGEAWRDTERHAEKMQGKHRLVSGSTEASADALSKASGKSQAIEVIKAAKAQSDAAKGEKIAAVKGDARVFASELPKSIQRPVATAIVQSVRDANNPANSTGTDHFRYAADAIRQGDKAAAVEHLKDGFAEPFITTIDPANADAFDSIFDDAADEKLPAKEYAAALSSLLGTSLPPPAANEVTGEDYRNGSGDDAIQEAQKATVQDIIAAWNDRQPPAKPDAVNPARTEAVVKEIGPPPFEGAVFDKGKHRWIKPGEVTPAGEGDGKEEHKFPDRHKKGGSAAEVKYASTIKSHREQDDALAASLFGTEDPEPIAAVVGAPDDAVVKFKTVFGEENKLQIEIHHDDLEQPAIRHVYKDEDGKLVIENKDFRVKPDRQGKGLGAEIFARQVEQAEAMGVDRIECMAARLDGNDQKAFNGYYTWPRFGYDESLDTVGLDTPDELAAMAECRRKFPDAKTVLDVMSTKEGAAWWKENGVDMTMAKFDLKPGSRSMAILTAYLDAKASKA